MTETDAPTHAETGPAAPEKPLYPSQTPWLVGVYTGFSFGLYLIFYLYLHARDLKRLGKDVTPWMWLFAPIIALALFFTVPRLGEEFQTLGKEYGAQPKNHGAMAAGFVFLGGLIGTLADRLWYEYAITAQLLAAFVVAVVFSMFAGEIRKTKCALPEQWFAAGPTKTTVGTWIWGVLVFCVAVPILFLGSYGELSQLTLKKMPPGVEYVDNSKLFSVTPPAGWSIAELGTHSDGSAVAEFSKSGDQWVIVFDHSPDGSPRDIAIDRKSEFEDTYSREKCVQRRWLEETSLVRRSEVKCEGTYLRDPVIRLSTVIDDGDSIIEVLGEVSFGSLQSSEPLLEDLRAFTRGITLLTKETSQ